VSLCTLARLLRNGDALPPAIFGEPLAFECPACRYAAKGRKGSPTLLPEETQLAYPDPEEASP
jgi:hypothetical protein